MEQIQSIYKKYQQPINFIIFGVATTLVNIVVYFLLFQILQISNIISTVLAWVVAIIFAYGTNRTWVFKSSAKGVPAIGREFLRFIIARLVTGVLDVAIMWVAVDILHFQAILMKAMANIIVVILNYVFSKLIIFK